MEQHLWVGRQRARENKSNGRVPVERFVEYLREQDSASAVGDLLRLVDEYERRGEARQSLLQQMQSLLCQDEDLLLVRRYFWVPGKRVHADVVAEFGPEYLADFFYQRSGGSDVDESCRLRSAKLGKHPLADDVRLAG